VNEYLNQENLNINTLNLGVPDAFMGSDKPGNMLKACGLDEAGIQRAINQRLALIN